MYSRFLAFLFVLFSFGASCQAELSKAELLAMLAKPLADTTLIDTYNELAWPIYAYDLPDSSIFYANKAIALAQKVSDLKRLSIAHRRLGITYINTGDVARSIFHQEESYRLSEKIHFSRGMQIALNNIGVAYLNNELLNKALDYFLRSLKIVEDTKDYSRVSNLYSNCGTIYRRTGDYQKSKRFFLKAKYYSLQQHDTEAVVVTNCNLSSVYRNMNKLDSARLYLDEAKKGLNGQTSTNTKYIYYLNEGLELSSTGQTEKALNAFLNCTALATNVSDKITVLINIGEEYKKLGDTKNMLRYFQEAYDLSKQNDLYNNLQYLSFVLARHYQGKDHAKFAQLMNLHLNYRDSNDKYTRVQQLQQQQLEFDFERRHVADSIKFEQREKLKNIQLEAAEEKLTREKHFKILLLVVLIIIIAFAVFILNRFILIRRQNRIIELQKQLVETKNREILDSINYARRLQGAILPQTDNIKKDLQVDILYLPKDIIGGDFYFFEKHGDLIYFAVCDCTGHGIPGALMSVVCHQALQKSIKEFNLQEPAAILSKTRQLIINSLNAEQQNIQDGMDCSLLAIHATTGKLTWAGAYNPLWMLSGDALTEISANKQPVALYEKAKEFVQHELNILPGTMLYLFTDGFADQFGGIKGKKYKQKQLKEFLASVAAFPLEEQISKLHLDFIAWKGPLDQVDDVTIAILRF